MNRRRFLLSSAGATAAVLGGPWVGRRGAATDDELAFANFGVSAEFLLKDFYARALAGKQFRGARRDVLRQGRSAPRSTPRRWAACSPSAGDTAPLEEDFEFVWPRRAFATAPATVTTGLTVLRALLGAYLTAAASVSVADYRILYASLGASVGQQIGALSALRRPRAPSRSPSPSTSRPRAPRSRRTWGRRDDENPLRLHSSQSRWSPRPRSPRARARAGSERVR